MATPEDQPLMHSFEDKASFDDIEPQKSDENHSLFIDRWNNLSGKTKFAVHGLILCFYTLLCITIILTIQNRSSSGNCPSPIIPSTEIKYRPKTTPNFLHSEYAGRNHHEIDLKWHDLLENISLRATDEELAMNHNHHSSVPLLDGGGQLVWLEASHHLHCVKMLRQWVYRDVYFAGVSGMPLLKMERHIDHCLEMLRQVVMCRPDTSLTTFLWVASQDKPILNIDPLEHDCVDWDLMVESLSDRVVSLEEINALKNPLRLKEEPDDSLLISFPLGSDE